MNEKNNNDNFVNDTIQPNIDNTNISNNDNLVNNPVQPNIDNTNISNNDNVVNNPVQLNIDNTNISNNDNLVNNPVQPNIENTNISNNDDLANNMVQPNIDNTNISNNDDLANNMVQPNIDNANISNNDDLANNMVQPNIDNTNINNKEQLKPLKIISLITGIICIIVVFIVQVFSMPISLIGMILGIIYTIKNKKICAGLILNIISFIIAIPLLLIYVNLFNLSKNPTNEFVGTWNCKNYNSGYYEDSDYIRTIKFTKNNKFLYASYLNEKDSYITGDFEIEDLHKTNYAGDAEYYSITLNVNKIYSNGETSYNKTKMNFEAGVGKQDKIKSAVFINADTYLMLACFLEDSSNPHINSKYIK